MKNRTRLYLVVATLFLFVSRADACSVPVFRYALERWESAPYQAIVFHRGALNDDDKRAIDALKQAGEAPNATANIHVRIVDLNVAADASRSDTRALARLWASQKNAALPWTVLLYPDTSEDLAPFWSGTLTAQRVAQLVSSPARIGIAKKLASGDSAVWALVLTGDKQIDATASLTLEAELSKLQDSIALPKDDDTQGGELVRLRSDLPLKIAFSIVHVSRTDPAEAMFVAMLTGMDKRFRDASQPIAFPIFGRGRALTGLTGKDLAESTIEEATSFLTAACSCQLKELNPGVDMLFETDWEGILDASRFVEKPAAVAKAISNATEKKPELVPLPPVAPRVESHAADEPVVASSFVGIIVAGLVLSGVLVLGAGIWLLISKKKPS